MTVSRIARVSVAVGGASLLLGAGIAHAYWSSGGSGSATANSGTMTIDAAALTGEHAQNALFPGGTADAIIKLDNPNGYSVHVIAITMTGTPQAANGCSPTGVTFTAPTGFTDARFTLPANQSTVIDLPGAVAMDTTSASACQGQTFSLPVTVTVQK